MLRLHSSNRHEVLQARLIERLAPGRGHPLRPDELIVPSAALRRALTLALADAQGICANLQFAYLADWLWQQVVKVVPGVDGDAPFRADRLCWRVRAAFEDGAFVQAHPRLAAYLGRADAVMRYELARSVAGLFEQYVTYRADWLDRWQDGLRVPALAAAADETWQAALWQRIVGELGLRGRDPVAAFLQALARADRAQAERWGLPAAVQIVAPPAIPPVHLAMLQALSLQVEIDLYLPNPCREFWFELVEPRRLAHLAARGRDAGHEVGHPLLAGWGMQTQALLDAVWSLPESSTVDEEAEFVEPGEASLLGRLQRSILDLAELAPGSCADLAADDAPLPDIEVHVCHSTPRELEVLHDRLLARFAVDPTLRASDVLVVTPDLEAAAPLIDAVFGTAPPARRLPYAITGRAPALAAAPVRALLVLLAVCDSRWAVSEVYGLLQEPIVARRCGLDDESLQQVHAALLAAGVHWGLDAGHRAELGLPAEARHSLRDGLDRLYLGYALPGDADSPFDGRLPAGDLEGSDAPLLGALWRFVDDLARLRAEVAQPQSPAAWAALLAEACERFLDPRDDEVEELQELLATVQALAADMASAQAPAAAAPRHAAPEPASAPAAARPLARGETADLWADDETGPAPAADAPGDRPDDASRLPFAVLREALRQRLDEGARGGVPTGRISFASMSALRGLPFRVVCAFGLNDGAWPTGSRPLEFDLLAQAPRRGDRQRRLDERNVMLDLLLAARDGLQLSYVGRSVRDNAPLPPSVLLAELLELLLPALAAAPQDAASRARARRRLVVEHPLQGFSPEAFRPEGDPRRRSHREEYARALRAVHAAAASPGPRAAVAGGDSFTHGAADLPSPASGEDGADGEGLAPAQAPFFDGPLPPLELESRELPLDRLIEFFVHPGRFLLRRRLGLDLGWQAAELSDDEGFNPGGRDRQALAARLLPALLRLPDAPPAAERETARRLAAAGTDWPSGPIGEQALEALLDPLLPFARTLRAVLAQPPLVPQVFSLPFEIEGERWQLSGGFADLRPGGLLRWRYGSLRATDLLRAWIAHLALCASAPAGAAPRTRWLHAGGDVRMNPPPDPRALLGALVALYRRGRREPLPFYPRSSFAFAHGADDWRAAETAWTPGAFKPGAEAADPHWQLALRGHLDQALQGDFAALARAVFDPLIAHTEGLGT